MPGDAGHSSIRAFRGYLQEAAPAPGRREEAVSQPILKLHSKGFWLSSQTQT